MTSELKCPFCGEELDEDTLGDFSCINRQCKESICFSGSKLLWQELAQVKQDLKNWQHNYSVKSEQHERGYAYATKTIKDLESKLEVARKALKIAVRAIETIKYSKKSDAINLRHKANKALIDIYKIKGQMILDQKE